MMLICEIFVPPVLYKDISNYIHYYQSTSKKDKGYNYIVELYPARLFSDSKITDSYKLVVNTGYNLNLEPGAFNKYVNELVDYLLVNYIEYDPETGIYPKIEMKIITVSTIQILEISK